MIILRIAVIILQASAAAQALHQFVRLVDLAKRQGAHIHIQTTVCQIGIVVIHKQDNGLLG